MPSLSWHQELLLGLGRCGCMRSRWLLPLLQLLLLLGVLLNQLLCLLLMLLLHLLSSLIIGFLLRQLLAFLVLLRGQFVLLLLVLLVHLGVPRIGSSRACGRRKIFRVDGRVGVTGVLRAAIVEFSRSGSGRDRGLAMVGRSA